MKYSVIINNEAKAETNNFDQMVAFVKSSDFTCGDSDEISLTYEEDGKTLTIGTRGGNCCAEFSDCLKCYRLGR